MTPLIYGAMPLRGGGMHGASALTFWRFFRDSNLDFVPQSEAFNEDVYRVRSRIARHFLAAIHPPSGRAYTHLFFLDSDVSCEPATLQKLVNANKPVIAAPYPKKHMRHFPNYEPTWYPTGLQDGDYMPALVPMGCTLIERSVVERVSRECVAAYERRGASIASLVAERDMARFEGAHLEDAISALQDGATCFGDVVDNVITPHVFGPITGDNPIHPEHPPNAWPEDMSFCLRCNRLGIPTVMHMGVTAYHHEGSVMFPVKEGR